MLDSYIAFGMLEKAEHEIIQKYAEKGSCVIVGRSANFVLEEKDVSAFYMKNIS